MATRESEQIDRIKANVTNALAKVAAKGVTVAADANSDDLPGLIESISQGTELPELTAPGEAADLRSGKQLIDGDGNVVDGTMPDVEVPTAEQVLLNSTGTIYATVTQSAGYTPGGTTTTQLDLPVQEGKTITPTKSKQTAVSAGRWCAETVEVAPIPDEYVIPSGTLKITKNGAYDVANTEMVQVEVAEDLTAVLDEQDAIITELEAALEGKAAGGSGGASVETCTVTFGNYAMLTYCYIGVTRFVDGNYIPEMINVTGTETIENVVVGAAISIYMVNGGMTSVDCYDDIVSTQIGSSVGTTNGHAAYIAYATSTAGGTIEFM